MTETDLLNLAEAAPSLYRVSQLKKKQGGYRVIEAPFKRLKAVQALLLRRFLYRIPIHPILHGGPATSTKTAAKAHVCQPVVVTLDIQDFFPSIKATTVFRALISNGSNTEVARIVTRLVTRKSRLPQGAPTSSAIARVVLFDLCVELLLLLGSIGKHARATVYVDDVTISGPRGLKRLVPTVTSLFRRYGYTINRAKVKAMFADDEQVVLGLRVNERVEPSSQFEKTLKEQQQTRSPRDPKRKGMESYKQFILSQK